MRSRFRWLLLAGPVGALPLIALPFVAVAEVPSSIDHYAASAKAGAVHVYGYDTTLQFATVDSSFPLAYSTQAGQSGLGYSDATATYHDYGPAGATLLGVPDGLAPPAGPPVPPPNSTGLNPDWLPPAHASYPGTPQSTLYPGQCTSPQAPPNPPCPGFGAPGPPPSGGAYATARADELGSHAFATYVGQLPTDFQGLTSKTDSVVGSDGTLTTTGEAFVAEATIGPFVFDKIHVLGSVSSSGGTGRVVQSTVTVGSVQANGQTVSLTDQGLTVGPVATDQPISLSGAQSAGEITYTAALVAPQQVINGDEATLTLTGVRVTAVETVPNAVPVAGSHVISEEYDLGFASLDAAAAPASQFAGGLGISFPSGGLGTLSGTGPLVAGAFPSTLQAPPAAAAKPNTAPRLVLVSASRKPLAVAFLGWEALVMCGVAAWVWARKTVAA